MFSLRFSVMSGVVILGLGALAGCDQSEPMAPPPAPPATDFQPKVDDTHKPGPGSSKIEGGSESGVDSTQQKK